MKNKSPVSKLKNAISEIYSLTHSTHVEINKRKSKSVYLGYRRFELAAIESDRILIYKPEINNTEEVTFAIVANDNLLSMTIKYSNNHIKGTIPMEVDAFKPILKSAIKEISKSPSLWLSVLEEHFITKALDDTEYRKLQKKSYADKQKEIIELFETKRDEATKSRRDLDKLKAKVANKISVLPEQQAVNDLKAQLKKAEYELDTKANQIRQDHNLTCAVDKYQRICDEMKEAEENIDWKFYIIPYS